ncbi:hypothetical protein PVAG01_07798 [Phlyctema vagabunda]|uniref:Major facilitator superfamily (MFS) profile domain-containing protein n=1 Tax=Phlyctema vagabunda TaxID=108571 RepID=A0ABR4PDF6_9HELO
MAPSSATLSKSESDSEKGDVAAKQNPQEQPNPQPPTVPTKVNSEKYFDRHDGETKSVGTASIASRRNPAINTHQPKPRDQHEIDTEKGPAHNNEEQDDSSLVGWDGPDDPHNPMNWSSWLKVSNIILISGITFVTPLASSMAAPGVPLIMREFESTSTELAAFVISVYVLGFAFGPMFLAPMSETYGRLPIYHICNVFFNLFNIACALAKNLDMLIGFRFLAGIFGSVALTNGGGTITDIVRQEKRGRAMSFFVIGPLLGPIIGPIAGGYLSEAKGWRWVFWVLSILGGLFTILCFIFLRETYAVVLLERKTQRKIKETGNINLRSKLDNRLSAKDLFLRAIVRPYKLLILSPIVLFTSIYVGLIYAYLYLLFTTFTSVFEESYGFSPGTVGLSYLGLGIGSMMGLTIFAVISDRLLKKMTKEGDLAAVRDGKPPPGMKPEYRLPPMAYCAWLIPAGFFIYGWTTRYKVHWIVPIMSTSLIGIGNLAVFMCIQMYLVDAYTIFAASALAANTIIRSIMAAVLPLCGQKMYDALGLGWGNSLLAFLALAGLPIPWALMIWGEKLRNKFKVTHL